MLLDNVESDMIPMMSHCSSQSAVITELCMDLQSSNNGFNTVHMIHDMTQCDCKKTAVVHAMCSKHIVAFYRVISM